MTIINLEGPEGFENRTIFFPLVSRLFTVIRVVQGRPNTRTESGRGLRAIFLEEITKNVVERGTRRCLCSFLSFSKRAGQFCFIPLHPSSSSPFEPPSSTVKIVYEGLNIRWIPRGDYNSWTEVAPNEGMPRGG